MVKKMLRDDCDSLTALKRIHSVSCCKYLHLRACYLHGHLLLVSDLLTICLFFFLNLKPSGLCLVFIFCFTVHLAKATSSHGLCDVEVSEIHPFFFFLSTFCSLNRGISSVPQVFFCLFPFYLSTLLRFFILLISKIISHLLGICSWVFYWVSNLAYFKATVFCVNRMSLSRDILIFFFVF